MYGAILGGAEPKPFISIRNMFNEEIQAKLDPKPDIEQSREIYVSVVAIKNRAKAELPIFVCAGQDQPINISHNFNKNVTRICIDVCKYWERRRVW